MWCEQDPERDYDAEPIEINWGAADEDGDEDVLMGGDECSEDFGPPPELKDEIDELDGKEAELERRLDKAGNRRG